MFGYKQKTSQLTSLSSRVGRKESDADNRKTGSSLRKFDGHHHDLVDHYGISVSQMIMDMLDLS
jgi:hypothetical protein